MSRRVSNFIPTDLKWDAFLKPNFSWNMMLFLLSAVMQAMRVLQCRAPHCAMSSA